MKKLFFTFWLWLAAACALPAQSTALYNDNIVGSIFITLPEDSLDLMIENLENEHYYRAQFIFDDGPTSDTLEDVGLRLRGNTSLFAQKKSFKVSFDAYAPDRKYQGVRKLNLRGSHNDPTMIREKLFYEVWKNAGLPERRAAFVKLYINGLYRGLYTNLEEIDKAWLNRAYDDNEGNLFKCTWPADLAYHGPTQGAYKAIMNNPETRAYDLVTNEAADDYSRLVALITALNQPVNAGYPANLEAILNVETVLKAFAIDVATGNWDDYFFNKNNYYLYDNPLSGRFEYVTFDTDNTFGVDWLGVDWAERDALQWHNTQQARPLATQLLAVPQYFDRFVLHLDSVTRYLTNPGIIFPRIDALHTLITPAAEADQFRTLDYGYSIDDFHDGFTQTIDGHTPYGIKPFLGLRSDSTLQQIEGLVSAVATPGDPSGLQVFPNPGSGSLFLHLPDNSGACTLFDLNGRPVKRWEFSGQAASLQELQLEGVAAGVYVLESGGKRCWVVRR